jgi:hypothetical protein
VSYAEIAAKGPKQTPEEVRAAKELFQQFLATGMIVSHHRVTSSPLLTV